MKKINIGIVAHVDAGKTTVTEHLLYNSGVIKNIGRVDDGNTVTDSMELERKRGISIKSATTSFMWNDVKINIIDTPGHVDFISEVERSLSILDGAILVVSAKEGIQSQTKILFDTLRKLQIPTIIFVNKVDRIGCNYENLLMDMKINLSNKIVGLQKVYNEGCRDVYLGELFERDIIDNDIVNVLGELDEGFLEGYINEVKFSRDDIKDKVSYYSRLGELYPVLYGSALLGIGIKNLLDNIGVYLPPSTGKKDDELSGVVFKIERSNPKEKKIYVRLFSGKISLRDTIKVVNKDILEKVTKINSLKDGKAIEVNDIFAGDIGIIYDHKDLQIGDVIGSYCDDIKKISIAKPILKTKISPVKSDENVRLFKVLSLLSEEDPLLQVEWNDIANEIYVNLFGDVQMEIIKSLLEDSYGIEVEFSETITIYKEAVMGIGTGLMEMWKNKNPFAATIGFKVEPLKRGEGLKYVSEVSTGSLPKTFQNGIEDGVFKTVKQGLLGWEVTDTKITLTHGAFNSVESTPADFRNLAPMVLMEAIDKAKTELLEPIYDFELRVPSSVGGKAISDLQRMRAVFTQPVILGDDLIIKGTIPIDTCKNYKLIIASYTEGKGVFISKFHGYQRIDLSIGKTRDKTMVDPLNKKEYLMYKLNAIRN